LKGGPRKGSGRPRKCPDTVRDKVVRLSITDSELAVLEILAEQWDVPIATAAYGLFADQIASCRRSKPLALPQKLVYAASAILAKYEPEVRLSGRETS
jgi:hypothetical protein